MRLRLYSIPINKLKPTAFAVGFLLHTVFNYADILQHASDDDEYVKDGMDVSVLFAESVKHRSDGVCDASREHKSKSDLAHSRYCGGEVNGNAPSHPDVADHRKDLEFFHLRRMFHEVLEKLHLLK